MNMNIIDFIMAVNLDLFCRGFSLISHILKWCFKFYNSYEQKYLKVMKNIIQCQHRFKTTVKFLIFDRLLDGIV